MGDDFSQSMSRSLNSASQSYSGSLIEARKKLGLPEDADISQNLSFSDASFSQSAPGHYSTPEMIGPEAPGMARVLYSLLKNSGVSPNKISKIPSGDGLNRTVTCEIPSRDEEKVAKNFVGISEALAQQQPELTRILTASLYLDQDRDAPHLPPQATKLYMDMEPQAVGKPGFAMRLAESQPGFNLINHHNDLQRVGKLGFALVIQTNEAGLMEALQKAGIPGRSKIFNNSSQSKNDISGVEYPIPPERSEEILGIIEDFAKARGDQLQLREQPKLDGPEPRRTERASIAKLEAPKKRNPLDPDGSGFGRGAKP